MKPETTFVKHDASFEKGTAPTRAAVPSPKRRGAAARRALTPYLFVLPALVYMAGLLAYPMVLNVLTSFKDVTAVNLLSGDGQWVGLENYRQALGDSQFVDAAVHSVVYALAAVALQLLIGLALALFYVRSFPGATATRSLYLIGYAIPIVVSAEVFRWLLDGRTGFVNWVFSLLGLQHEPVYWLADRTWALPAIIGIQVWLGIPFAMVTLLAGLTAIPHSLHEAAQIDGATGWRRFRHITVPLLRPTFLAAAILSLIFTFKNFDLIWIATQGGPANASEVLPTLAYKLVFLQFLFGKGAAVLNVIFLVLLVLSLLYLAALRREEDHAA
ncbi:sugar ABC transporter permease [Planotetraspora sp. A-T 1434]|uniref:carbohydrate ABC transporter permease n=1 Tax=Planotetraspora sp. A-T 1434 TaxID=2979219 RepID=UPI0021BFF060|nr:sugar ABC transporter permease [Planotetraspora sp. A-T 1434]MCT9929285.1 sugar ABC transporter permease [Planotetraspora sp. A-T 1434]